MKKIIEKYRMFLFPPRMEKDDHRLEGDLRLMARYYQRNDPATDIQWKQLRTALEMTSTRKTPSGIFQSGFVTRPAFSFSLAAAVLVVVGLVWMKNPFTKIYETAKGQHSTIMLQDSTEVTLNYLSELSVNRWTLDKARHVYLKGEALFHVRRDGTPFILKTEVGTVQVLGTEFNVRVRDGKMIVGVLSGSVRVSVSKDGKDSSIVLSKGQIALCAENDYPGLPTPLSFADYPGWLRGKITCYRSSVESVCRELESQLDIKIKIENPQIRTATLTGMINGQNPEAALTTLVQLTGNAFRYEAGSYIIY